MKTVEIDGKDISKITDYKGVLEIRKTISKSEKLKEHGMIPYISPKDDAPRKVFEKEFVRRNKDVNLLYEDDLLKTLFKNYESIDVELYLYNGTSHKGRVIYRLSFIDFVLGNYSDPKFL